MHVILLTIMRRDLFGMFIFGKLFYFCLHFCLTCFTVAWMHILNHTFSYSFCLSCQSLQKLYIHIKHVLVVFYSISYLCIALVNSSKRLRKNIICKEFYRNTFWKFCCWWLFSVIFNQQNAKNIYSVPTVHICTIYVNINRINVRPRKVFILKSPSLWLVPYIAYSLLLLQ